MGQVGVQEGSGWHGRPPQTAGGWLGSAGRQRAHLHEGSAGMCGELVLSMGKRMVYLLC